MRKRRETANRLSSFPTDESSTRPRSISPPSKYLQTFAFLFDTFFYPLFHPPVDGIAARFITVVHVATETNSLAWMERGWKEGEKKEKNTWEERRREMEDGGEEGREFVPRLSGDNLQNCLARTARHRAIPLVVLSADDPRMIIVPRTGTRYVALPSSLSPGEYTPPPVCKEQWDERAAARGFANEHAPTSIHAPNI